MKKTYLVFGAAGSIGQEIVNALTANGENPVALISIGHHKARAKFKSSGVCLYTLDDVSEPSEVKDCSLNIQNTCKIQGVIYAVGHCPPNGFPEEIKYPLSQLPLERYQKEIGMHQVGVLNVFQSFVDKIEAGGCFVFISSAITRLRGKFPPFLQAYHHASVIDAEDWLVDGMRHDPIVAERKLKIHRLAPAAVDTPFHQSGPRPPKLLPISTIVDEVVSALESDTEIDKQVL